MAAGSRRRIGIVLILLALVLILMLAFAVYLMRDQLFPTQPGTEALPTQVVEPMVEIVVLAQPVARGTTINNDMLAMIMYPQREMVTGLFFTDKNEVVNKRANQDLQAGVPLTSGLVSDTDTGSYAAFRIPRGMVSVSIPITKLSSVAYALQPGDHVNVIGSLLLVDLDSNFQTELPNRLGQVIAPGTGETGTSMTVAVSPSESSVGRTELDSTLNSPIYMQPSESQRPRLVSQTLIQDAVVLWVGQFPTDGKMVNPSMVPTVSPEADPAAAEAAAATATVDRTVISLIVTPQDAVTLNYLMLSGAKLSLALRGAGDIDIIQTQSVTLQYLLEQYGITNPTKLPYGTEPRVDDMLFPQDELAPSEPQPAPEG
jgi:pilus assembly protein CpaB